MLLVPCYRCGGTGLIDRPVDETKSLEPWSAVLFAKTLCNLCGGSGKVTLDPQTVKE